jgi:phosphatidylglycerol:prolipoprotein diacylglycerol transferase
LQLADPLYFLKIWQGGMSFHGGLIGVMVSMLVYANRKGFTFFQVTDWIAPQVPIALFLGRVANFINAELFGRPTDVPWGMVFPTDPLGLVRHPSQIYEALLEGIMLFIFLNFLIKKTEKVGRHSGYFLIGYGVARSISEIFRTPDTVWGNDFLLFSFLTQGQLLSVPMIILGVFILSRK